MYFLLIEKPKKNLIDVILFKSQIEMICEKSAFNKPNFSDSPNVLEFEIHFKRDKNELNFRFQFWF